MSDTIQGVRWSLERYCPYRTDQRSQSPETALKDLNLLRGYSHALADGKVIGDACVTSWTYSKDYSGPCGYRVSDKFTKFVSLPIAQSTCGSCEANAWPNPDGKMAGCAGFVVADPDSPDLEKSLASAIERQSLDNEMASAFVHTTPRWYGLWVRSPLNPAQCGLLLKIITHILDPDEEDRRFWVALKIAANHTLPLHVSMAPPGHMDFDIHTVFPHCPRCKAHSGLEWQEQYPTTPRKCPICSHDYIPAQTASTESFESESDPRLDQILTQDEMRAVAAQITWKPITPAPDQLFVSELWNQAKKKMGKFFPPKASK